MHKWGGGLGERPRDLEEDRRGSFEEEEQKVGQHKQNG